jgi:hypothetical protein
LQDITLGVRIDKKILPVIAKDLVEGIFVQALSKQKPSLGQIMLPM